MTMVAKTITKARYPMSKPSAQANRLLICEVTPMKPR